MEIVCNENDLFLVSVERILSCGREAPCVKVTVDSMEIEPQKFLSILRKVFGTNEVVMIVPDKAEIHMKSLLNMDELALAEQLEEKISKAIADLCPDLSDCLDPE